MVVLEVAPGVFAATDLVGANVGLISSDDGAVLVDAPLVPAQARAWGAQVERLAPRGVSYIINTDYHLGHSLGTSYLPPCLTVAHEAAWRHMRTLDRSAVIERAAEQYQDRAPGLAAQLTDVRLLAPQISVGKALSLYLRGRRVDIIHLGGHSAAALGVYVPDARVLFAGDVLVQGRHPYAGDANLRQWLEALDYINSLDVETVVPGHGVPGGRSLLEPVQAYLWELRARVEQCLLAGHSRRETVERVRLLDAFPVPPGGEERVRRVLRSSIERVYDELKRESVRPRQRA
ncbi:MAG: MBL fold metallo-hydrolase [Anaerolineae bacterium]